MISTIISIAFFVASVVEFFLVRNLLKKQENLEDICDRQQDYVSKLSETIAYCTIKINQIDAEQTFASDDQIGWWFDEVKQMQELLNQYNMQDD